MDGLKILYIEDDAHTATRVKELALSRGDDLHWESDGAAGLRIAGRLGRAAGREVRIGRKNNRTLPVPSSVRTPARPICTLGMIYGPTGQVARGATESCGGEE